MHKFFTEINKTYILLVFLVAFTSSADGILNFSNNACNSYISYYFRYISKDCHHDDKLFLQTPQILDLWKLPYENHTVVTEDGYILSIFRVKKSNPKGVIVMLHPIAESSTTWFISDNQSYVMNFFNAGYELWLLNWRGVIYSDKHINPKITEQEYWNFSFHEIGIYDYSAVFRYVYNITGTKLIAFSMSIGSTAATIYASEKPDEVQKMIKIFVAMAVPAYMQQTTSLLRVFTPVAPLFKIIQRVFGFSAFFHRFKSIINLFQKIALFLNLEWLVALIGPPLLGKSTFEPSYLSFGSITPEAVSFKTLYHFGQLMTNGNRFAQYDYGKEKNLEMYNLPKPPDYQVEHINVPFYIIYGENDNLASTQSNLILYSKLPNVAKTYGIFKLPDASHGDFLIGKNAPNIAQQATLDVLEKVKQDNTSRKAT